LLASRKMATMAMPVTGATAVAPRASLRAKASVRGARVVGFKPAALRPAAVRVNASAQSVEKTDDLQLGQVRPRGLPNIGSPGLVSIG